MYTIQQKDVFYVMDGERQVGWFWTHSQALQYIKQQTHTYIVAWHDSLDGHRTAVIAVQDNTEEGARTQADAYFADWNFHEPEYINVSITKLPAKIEQPVYIELGD